MSPAEIKVIGMHAVPCSPATLDEAVELKYGRDLTPEELRNAQTQMRKHFDGLRLIVIEVIPADAEVDWSRVVQPTEDVDPSYWQAPYDEELVDPIRGRWAFFLHNVRPTEPLSTPLGPRTLPSISPCPPYCSNKVYDLP